MRLGEMGLGNWNGLSGVNGLAPIVTGKQIGRASCRERV